MLPAAAIRATLPGMASAPVGTPGGIRSDPGLRAIAGAYLLAGLLLPTIGAIVASLRDELGMGGALAALHPSTFGIGMAALGLGPGAALVRRVGPVAVLRGAIVLVAAGAVALAIGRTAAVTLPGAAGIGGGVALIVLAMPPVIRCHPAAGPHAFTDVNALYALGAVAGPSLLALAEALGLSWRLAFGCLGAVAGVAALALAGRARLPEADGEDGTGFALLARGRFRLAFGVLLLVAAVEVSFTSWASAFAREVRDDPAVVGTLVLVGFTVGQAVGRFGSRLVERAVPPRRILPALFLVSGLGALLLVLAPGGASRVAAGLVTGLGASLLYPRAIGRMFDLAPGDAVGVGAIAALGSGVSIAILPVVLGVVADGIGLTTALMLVPVAAVGGVLATSARGYASA